MVYVSRKYAHVLFVALVALAMTAVMSLVMTLMHSRLDGGFFARWMRAMAIGYVCALPTALVVVPPIKRLVDRITR
jgi:hypothetical protein